MADIYFKTTTASQYVAPAEISADIGNNSTDVRNEAIRVINSVRAKIDDESILLAYSNIDCKKMVDDLDDLTCFLENFDGNRDCHADLLEKVDAVAKSIDILTEDIDKAKKAVGSEIRNLLFGLLLAVVLAVAATVAVILLTSGMPAIATVFLGVGVIGALARPLVFECGEWVDLVVLRRDIQAATVKDNLALLRDMCDSAAGNSPTGLAPA